MKRRKSSAPSSYTAYEALALLLREYSFHTVLDVGCGDGAHARVLRQHGKEVTAISLEQYSDFAPDFVGDVLDFRTKTRFDVVWCSHVLEHQPDVRRFLRRLMALAMPGGLLAITVPPARRRIVGGHLTVWNTGLLLYNLVVAGIDCRHARAKVYGYNISIIVPAQVAELPRLRHDAGDIERLAPFFPMPVKQGFDGRIYEIAWSAPLERKQFTSLRPRDKSDLAMLERIASGLRMRGHVMEFGVFRGRSICALARVLPDRIVHGFDSFRGLPSPWLRGPGSVYPTGYFESGAPPDVPVNVQLWPGWFEESMAPWLERHAGPIALAHIDCDLYESAATVLKLLNRRIVRGSVLVFDELCDWNESGVYPNWRAGEWRALCEWLTGAHRTVRPLARGLRFSGAVEVTN